MAGKLYPVRQSLNAGEVSELIAFRDDVAKYQSACLTLENTIPLVEGGAKKMPGTYFAGTTALGGSMFTGSISGTTLTVTAVNYGVLQAGQTVVGVGVAPGTAIVGSGSTGATGPVTGLGVSFTQTCIANLPPNVFINISGDGSGASATVTWSRFGPIQGSMYAWTPTLYLTGGSGYTAANATVTISNGNSVYPNGTTVYPCSITYSGGGGGGGTGTGGTGTYTVSISQTVFSELMQTASNGKSRLAPFQFSTLQGAILEFSAGIVRIWEGASQGQWSLGLALQLPAAATDYNPVTAYVSGNQVVIGQTSVNCFVSLGAIQAGPGILYISAPYGIGNAYNVPITFSVNGSDALSVTVTGSAPNQGINIALADTTPANNAATAIQAAIRALGSLNSALNNFVDLSAWIATPDSVYYATPWITATGVGSAWNSSTAVAVCTTANQNDEFPLVASGLFRSIVYSFNTPYWQNVSAFTEPPIELVTPYLESDLFELDLSTQSADVLWIFHPNYPPAVIERQAANSWVYSLSLPGQQPGESPYRGTPGVVTTGYSALGLYITAITQANPCVVTVSQPGSIFNIGSRVYINLVAGMVQVNEQEFITGSSVVNANGSFSFSLKDPSSGANIDSTGYLAYTSGGFAVQVVPFFANQGNYPACATLYQERLCVGGADSTPAQINGSVQGDYPDFIADPNADDHAIQFTLVSTKLDQIVNMIGTPNALLLGTAGGVWIMAGSNGESLSQTNVTASKQSSIGVSPLQAQLLNDSAIFVSRSARIVLFLVYNFTSNQWDNYDLTRLNRVITLGPTQVTSGIVQTTFQMEPYPIFWAVRADGQLIGLVFNKQDQVYAWFRINMLTQGGAIESVAVISGADQEDQIAIVVNRTINGVTQRFVEYFMPQELFSQLSNAFFVHCGQQWNGGPPVEITGITNANPCQVTAPMHGFSNGQFVMITDVEGMSQINQDKSVAYVVQNATQNTFTLDGSLGGVIDSTLWGVYTGGGTVQQVTNVVTGMSYLLGNTVVAVGDGALILQPTIVTSDSITFVYYSNLITIGVPYQLTIQPTNPVLTTQSTTTRGMKQKLNRVTLSLYEAMGGQYGIDLDHMYDITYGQGTKSKVPAMFTEEVTRDMDGNWEDEARFYVIQGDPLPFTLRGLVWRDSANQD